MDSQTQINQVQATWKEKIINYFKSKINLEKFFLLKRTTKIERLKIGNSYINLYKSKDVVLKVSKHSTRGSRDMEWYHDIRKIKIA